jgi:predicted nucleic acid-binding protein
LNEAVLDASVVLKWFRAEGEAHREAAQELRERFEAGDLRVFAPPLLWLEILNVAARSWGWTVPRLTRLATALSDLGFETAEPDLSEVARWAAAGLTAYDAAYVALAEDLGLRLLTDDAEVLRVAPQVAVPLTG